MTLAMGLGQVALKTNNQVEGYRAIPQERIFVHINSSLLLTGEYLYYKIYCLERESGSLSKLSKIAYVELVGPKGELILRHKIRLENGLGHGDFFVPTEVRSGVYKLLAYTHWMRNQDQANLFQSDMAIINPYLANQDLLQKTTYLEPDSLGKPKKLDNEKVSTGIEDFPPKNRSIDLTTNGKKFKKRAKVSLFFQNGDKNKTMEGDYSISIRKKDRMPIPKQAGMLDFFEKNDATNVKPLAAIGDTIYLPELRGELFSGKVIALQENKSAQNLKVALCIPGEDYFFEVVETDELGNFHLNIDGYYSGEKVVVQVLSVNAEGYEVQLGEQKPLDHSKLFFEGIRIDSSMREKILQRSIHNQIENSYFQFRPDSILSSPLKRFSDNKEKEAYLLDDYVRFKTLRETIIEIIKDVSFKRLDKDYNAIRIKGFDYTQVTDLPPLILMDGCLVQDNNALLDFDARTIESITVLRHKLVFGPEVFQGAMVISTKTGDGYGQFQKNAVISTEKIFEPRSNKKYFVQRYDPINDVDSKFRLPDDRLQLLWIPKFNLKDEQAQLEFFTSDVSGEFEIHLEGLTYENQPVSIRKSIYVD
jgi:hypothetical protein